MAAATPPPPPPPPTAATAARSMRVPWFVGGTRRKTTSSARHGKTRHHAAHSTRPRQDADPPLPPGVGVNISDPDRERDPPPRPTPVTFPAQPPLPDDSWSTSPFPPKLQPCFAAIVKPSDISDRHLAILNVHLEPHAPPEDLLPPAPDGSSYIPCLPSDSATNTATPAAAIKIDAAPTPKRKDFDDRLAELQIDNDTAIRVITRTTKPGNKPRIAYMRKFWEGLESVAQYWDTSLDQYYDGPVHKPHHDGEKDAKRQRLDGTPSILTLQTASAQTAAPPSPPKPDHGNAAEQADDSIATAAAVPLPPDGKHEQPEVRLRYKGRRTAAGSDMPDQFRADMVRSFVDGTTYAFGTQVLPPRQMPLVRINKLNVPVRQTAAVYRRCRDRTKARAGYLEGPAMTVQCRPETNFQGDDLDDKQMCARARLDAIRELGGLLQLAQERHREGKTASTPGAGQWWTCKPRWGGGPGGEVEKEENTTNGSLVKDVLQLAEDMVASASVHRETARRPKRKTPAMLWKELKPGSSTWDPKMDYQAIGKDPNSDYDEVFMVSSLNHHISILKLTVHNAYIDYLESEQLPDPNSTHYDEKWSRPRLQRTRWYNLLDMNERIEAFRALWGVSSYIFREVENEKSGDGVTVGREQGDGSNVNS